MLQFTEAGGSRLGGRKMSPGVTRAAPSRTTPSKERLTLARDANARSKKLDVSVRRKIVLDTGKTMIA
jgi:hypothetical protein